MPFCCVVARDNFVCRERTVREIRQRMAQSLASEARIMSGAFVALSATYDVLGRPLQATYRGHIGVGVVRLDNRAELMSQLPTLEATASDLDVALATLWHYGTGATATLLGDFGFVRWDPARNDLLAVRDAFGVKPLFYAVEAHRILLSGRLTFIGDDQCPDPEFIADFLVAGGDAASTHTVWANVQTVPPGGMLTWHSGRLVQRTYWSAGSFHPRDGGEETTQVGGFRRLFDQAVGQRIDGQADVWSELSGGTDSSSIVATAQLAGPGAGLAGTVTLVDELGSGDERRYSDLVVEQFGLRNETIWNTWPWQDDGGEPPRTDEPRVMYPYYARDRQMCGVIRRHSGRVLLSGLGSDHYLAGSRLFLADWLAHGQVRRAVRGMLEWAMHDRLSFWTTLVKEGIWPFVPRWLRVTCLPLEERPPAWIASAFARRMDIVSRLNLGDNTPGRWGHLFPAITSAGLQNLPRWLPIGPFQDELEVRYPFLDRRLVEFCLQLPPEQRLRPGATKWILRAAMQGRLPEAIRTRRGKGHIGARAVWALHHERARLEALTRNSILAQLGYVDPARLRTALEAAWRDQVPNTVLLLSVLALETWLAVRYDRWATVTHAVRSEPVRLATGRFVHSRR